MAGPWCTACECQPERSGLWREGRCHQLTCPQFCLEARKPSLG